MIKFDNKYYSVPYKLIGKSVDRVIILNEMHTYYNKVYITTHEINESSVNKQPEYVHASVKKTLKPTQTVPVPTDTSESDNINSQVTRNFEMLREAY